MPYNWNPSTERQMLLLAITKANLRPTSETWIAVASLLGNGLTPSAVSQKFYKLRAEVANSGTVSAKSTPKKRKRVSDREKDQAEYDNIDGEDATTVTPMRLIADHPYYETQEADQNLEDEKLLKESAKKQKAKREKFDEVDRNGNSSYVA